MNTIPSVCHWQGSDLLCLARIHQVAGTYITQSSILTITYNVYDLSTSPPTVSGSGTFALTTTISNTLVIDPVTWPIDNIGYNWSGVIPGACFPNAPIDYLVVVTFTPTAGASFPAEFRAHSRLRVPA